MTKEKALYQVKVILDSLDDEEYDLIPKEEIQYIFKNMEIDESFSFDENIPMEEQEIDEYAYSYLQRIVKDINCKLQEEENFNKKYKKYLEYNTKEFIEEIEKYKKETAKIKEIEELLKNYKNLVKENSEEIKRLKENNNELIMCVNKCPKIIRKIFFRQLDNKLLK